MVEPLHIEMLADAGVATVMARKDIGAGQIGEALGIAVPCAPGSTVAGDTVLLGVGPGTWLLQCDSAAPFWIEELRDKLAGLASVSDQSGAYCRWYLSGTGARTVLQRGAAIDFHPESFGAGSVVTTVIAHIGVTIRQIDDEPTYEVAVFRSYADSFRHWLDEIVRTF